MVSKYIIRLQRSHLTNSYLLGKFVFNFYFFVIMHKANFLVHKLLWAFLIIFLGKINSGDGITMSKSMGIFKALDLYCQHLLRKGHANLFFLQNSAFYFHEDDRAII